MTASIKCCFLFFAVASIGAAQLQISTENLSFLAVAGGASPPPQRIAAISAPGAPVTFSVASDGGAPGVPAPAWLQFRPRTLTAPATVHVSADPAGLAAGFEATARLILTDLTGVALRAPIPVRLQVSAGEPRLGVAPEAVRLNLSSAQPRITTQTVIVRNDGPGGLLPVAARNHTSSPWMDVSVSEPCTEICLVRIQVDRLALPPGPHRGEVEITTAVGAREVPVSVFMAGSAPLIALQPGTLRFRARHGHGLAETRSVSIINRGDAPASWTAQVMRGSGMLSLGASSGQFLAGESASLQVTVNAAGLAPGAHYGVVKISSPQARNTPRFLTVFVDVDEGGALAEALLHPAGLVAATAPGEPQISEAWVNVSTSSAAPVPFRASIQLASGTGWLSISPTTGVISSGSPATAGVSFTPTGLAPGVYDGKVNFSLGNLAIRSLNATLIVSGGPACIPSRLSATHLSLDDNFALKTGDHVPLVVRLFNDCGQPTTDGHVAVTFSNGDPSIPLQHLENGIYSSVWSPQREAEWVSVTAWATAPSFTLPGRAEQVGSVSPAPGDRPILAANGILHNLNPMIGGPLAPGTVAQIFGKGLASAVAQPPLSAGMLPDTFNGTTIHAGDRRAPMYYLSDLQLNAQLPLELVPGMQYEALVEVNGALTLPEPVSIVAVQPGVAVFPDGRVIAQDADFNLIDESNPARPGQAVVVYLVGMGQTNPPIGTGAQTPAALLSAISQPQLTLDGVPVEVHFAGLTPESVGLYQINFVVPMDARTGDLKLVIVQDGAAANESYLVVR